MPLELEARRKQVKLWAEDKTGPLAWGMQIAGGPLCGVTLPGFCSPLWTPSPQYHAIQLWGHIPRKPQAGYLDRSRGPGASGRAGHFL